MLGTPLTCSIILTKHKKYLYDSFSNEANYLYQTDSDDLQFGGKYHYNAEEETML